MELNDKVTQLEDEIKVLKNEVQAVLLDLRDSYLNRENPFNPAMSPMASPPIIINQPPPAQQPPVAEEEPERPDQASELVAENGERELLGLEEPASQAELTDEPELSDEVELTDEPEPVSKDELTDDEGTAHKEVKRARSPEMETEAHFKSGGTRAAGFSGKIDLATIDELARWVDRTVKQLGHERTETILDISEMMGHVAPDLKKILVKFINPVQNNYSGKITTRGYLASLIELDKLLGKENKSEVALLYILCQENDNR